MGRKPYAKPRFTAENTKGVAEIFAEQRAKPIDLSRPCAPKTEEDRKRAIQAWNDFISHVAQKEAVHEYVWEWLAGDDLARQNEAMALCKTFLHCLVSTSVKPKLVWGPEEQCEEQTIKAVTSVNTYWKTLIGGAQTLVLDRKSAVTGRKVDLARSQGPAGARDNGPVAKVTQWMMTDLRWTHNLTVDSGYDKVAATCKDIERLVKTLWERADDVPMTPYNRLTVHIYLLVLFFSGCRSGMLAKIMWDDVKLCLVPEPSVPSGRRLLVRLTLTFNKQDRVQVKQTERVTIDLAQMPTVLLDTTHLLAAKALHEDAFKYGFKTVDEMLNRPELGAEDGTHLEWKEGLRNQCFFKMSDNTFRAHFKRLCLVSGLENPPRPYFMRVGAGANLEDAGLPMPTICHIIGHTLQVHGQSYQTRRIRHDVQGAAFGEFAGSGNEDLFKHLDQAWKAYDPDAPIYMTEAQRVEMEHRRDTTAKREEIRALEEDGGDKREKLRLTTALSAHRKRLEELAILARREKFFKDKATSRQTGEREKQGNPEEEYYSGLTGTRSHAGINIRSLMQAWAPGTVFDAGAERRGIMAMEWLSHYLSSNRGAISVPAAASPLQDVCPSDGPTALRLPAGKQSMCLVCGAAFARRADMTRHAAKHLAILSREFSCPLCREITSSPSGFSNHVERKHGKEHAPHFVTGHTATLAPEEVQPRDTIPCAICHCEILRARVLQHFNMKHAGAPSLREATLSCAACPGQQEHSLESWLGHLANRHEVPVTEQCPFCGCLFQARGLQTHIRRAHFVNSSALVSCPLCTRAGDTTAFLGDHAAWLVHLQTAEHLGERATKMSGSATLVRTGTKRKAEGDPCVPGYAALQVLPPPSKVQRRDRAVDPCAPLSPKPAPEPSPSPPDLSLIDPALLGGNVSDTFFDGDDQTSLYGPSPQSMGGSTACTTPTTGSPLPVVAPEKLAAFIAEMQRGAEVHTKWSQEDLGCTADVSPPCLDVEDAQPSPATPSSPPEQEEEMVLDTIYVASPTITRASIPITHIDRPLRRSQRRRRRRVPY